MASYLELAHIILVTRENAIRSIDTTLYLLNEMQCTHLWRIIRVVYDYLSSSQLPAPQNRRHKYLPNIFREFYIIVTRADALVQQFSNRHLWLTAAVLQGNHQLAFKELVLDLQACVSVFADITQHPVSVAASSTIWRLDVAMESDAQTDAENLRIRVQGILAQPGSVEVAQHIVLAEYFLDRDRSMSRSDYQDSEHPQFCIASDGYPTVGKLIGHGSSGAVLEVEWLGMPCAKKHFSAATEDEGSMEECKKEVSISPNLNHPHIVKLLCTNVHSEISFLMELMPMSLSDFIKERWSSPEGMFLSAAIDMMLQIARGMEYLHEQGIVHRDLKSSNILVTPSKVKKLRDLGCGDLKLTDFGLAKMKVHDLTNPTRKKMGTPRWMAPEVHVAEGAIDWKKADAYSFAMTSSEILTGETPFSSARLSKLHERIMTRERPVKLPTSCPNDLVSLLEQCWDITPSVRPSFTKIQETLTSIKAELLEFQWNDRYPRKIFKLSQSAPGDCSPGLLCLSQSYFSLPARSPSNSTAMSSLPTLVDHHYSL